MTTYSNAGTLMIPAGVKVFPLKGHELTGGYTYRGIVDSKLLELAFAPEMAARGLSHIGKGSYHEAWGYWLWTLNPYFDIRLAGSLGFAANGSKDLARLSVCNPGGVSGTLAPTSAAYRASTPCHGDDVAMKAELRFRARF